MSVLNQQRLRIVRIEPDAYCPYRLWEVACPCCAWGLAVESWHLALGYALDHLSLQHCRYCIDGQMPAGHQDLLGELFQRCHKCRTSCVDCGGIAVYPTNYNTPTELIEDLATVRLTPVFCDACYGVVAVIPLDPEVHA
jgi:hypothetical protein